MTLGFVLIFLGAQLAIVDSYLLTPRISNFLSQQESDASIGNQLAVAPANGQTNRIANGPFRQVSYQNGSQPLVPGYQGVVTQKRVTPPKWLCWPILFCGTVVLLHGATMRRD